MQTLRKLKKDTKRLFNDWHAPVSQDRNNTSPFHSSGAFAAAPSSQHPQRMLVNCPSCALLSCDDDTLPTPSYPPTTYPCCPRQGTRSPSHCCQVAAAKRTSTGIPAPGRATAACDHDSMFVQCLRSVYAPFTQDLREVCARFTQDLRMVKN